MAIKQRDTLIGELVAVATPIERPARPDAQSWRWMLVAIIIALIPLLMTGRPRPNAWSNLMSASRYAFEGLLGVVSIINLSLAAFRSGIPSPTPAWRLALWPLGWFVLWVVVYASGLTDTSAISMLGKRAHCVLEVLALGGLGYAVGCYALRRLWPLHGGWSGALLGLAAGAIPALAMQFMCMYAPWHTLLFHILPAVMLGVVGAGIGYFTLRKS